MCPVPTESFSNRSNICRLHGELDRRCTVVGDWQPKLGTRAL